MGLARVDMFLQSDGRIVLNEVNTLPGFTAYSRYPRMMAAAGMGLSEVIDRAISSALARSSMEPGFVFLDEVLPGVRWTPSTQRGTTSPAHPSDGYEVNPGSSVRMHWPTR